MTSRFRKIERQTTYGYQYDGNFSNISSGTPRALTMLPNRLWYLGQLESTMESPRHMKMLWVERCRICGLISRRTLRMGRRVQGWSPMQREKVLSWWELRRCFWRDCYRSVRWGLCDSGEISFLITCKDHYLVHFHRFAALVLIMGIMIASAIFIFSWSLIYLINSFSFVHSPAAEPEMYQICTLWYITAP